MTTLTLEYWQDEVKSEKVLSNLASSNWMLELNSPTRTAEPMCGRSQTPDKKSPS